MAGELSTARETLESTRGQRRCDRPAASDEMNAGGVGVAQIVVMMRGGDDHHQTRRRADAMEATREGRIEVATAQITRARERVKRTRSHLHEAKIAGKKRVGDRHPTPKRPCAATGAKRDLLAGGKISGLVQ